MNTWNTNSATTRNRYLPRACCEGVSAKVVSGSRAAGAGSASLWSRRKAQAHTRKPMPASRITTLATDQTMFSPLGTLPISGSCGQLLV